VYDCIDGLVDDEQAIYKRGGTAYKSNSDVTAPLRGAWHARLAVGQRTMFWNSADLFYLDPSDAATVETYLAIPPPKGYRRMVEVGGLVAYVPDAGGGPYIWGGSEFPVYNTGTASATEGSRTVTGVGTAWNSNAQQGMILGALGNYMAVVDQVVSNTQLELTAPWAQASVAGGVYSLTPYQQLGLFSSAVPLGLQAEELYLTAVGTPPRLIQAVGNRLYFNLSGQVGNQQNLDYHEVPGTTLGVDAIRDNVIWFTDSGVYVVGNMNLDLVDADGNTQQTLQRISQDIILWDDAGIVGLSTYAGLVGWRGELIVPARDDIYIMGVDGPPVAISRGIRSLYRSYVAAGYRLGIASFDEGHYFLPVRNGDTIVDTLVCRIDQRDSRGNLRPAWTRLGSGVRCAGFAVRSVPPTGSVLVGAKGARLLDLSALRVPTAARKNDADGTGFNLDVTTNDLETPAKSTLQRVRLHYDLVDAASDNPTISASYAVDAQEGAALTGLSGTAGETTTTPKVWQVVKRGRAFRLRFLSSGPSSRLRLRALDWFLRDSDRP